MITDEDKKKANMFIRKVHKEISANITERIGLDSLEIVIAGHITRIRAESAGQARKESADRAVRFFDDFRICVPPYKYYIPRETLEQLRAAIIGEAK